MIDLGFSGNPFTLSNHKQGSSLILRSDLIGVLLIATGFTIFHLILLFISQLIVRITARFF
jgi:hypothetical protein